MTPVGSSRVSDATFSEHGGHRGFGRGFTVEAPAAAVVAESLGGVESAFAIYGAVVQAELP
jgi:hypothetical protein